MPSFTTDGDDRDELEVDAGACTGALDPGATCQATLRFHPTRDGAAHTTIIATAQPGGRATATAIGTASKTPTVALQITVTNSGGTVGRVTSMPSGVDCDGSCQVNLPVGEKVVLFATGKLGTPIAGISAWGGACTGAAEQCTLTLSESSTQVTVSLAPANYMFTTFANVGMTTLSQQADPLAYADTQCAQAATAAGLPGKYLAFLSTATVIAKDRLVRPGGGQPGGWYRTDGLPFASSLASLFTNSGLGALNRVYYPPRMSEKRFDLGATNVAVPVAVTSDGCAAPTADTKVLVGNAMSTGSWTGATQAGCDGITHLYCFGVDNAVLVSPSAPVGRLAFVASTMSTTGGVDTLDAACQGRAPVAGTFKALVASHGASAASRFDLTGATWFRPDGVQVFERASDLANPSKALLAPITVVGEGTYRQSYGVVTGAPSPIAAPTNTCSDYTVAAGPAPVESGRIGETLPSPGAGVAGWFNGGGQICQPLDFVYCLQN